MPAHLFAGKRSQPSMQQATDEHAALHTTCAALSPASYSDFRARIPELFEAGEVQGALALSASCVEVQHFPPTPNRGGGGYYSRSGVGTLPWRCEAKMAAVAPRQGERPPVIRYFKLSKQFYKARPKPAKAAQREADDALARSLAEVFELCEAFKSKDATDQQLIEWRSFLIRQPLSCISSS